MTDIFLKIVGMSLTACAVILVVLVLRIFAARVSKGLAYCLWAAVFLRLLCPFTVTLPDTGVQPVTVEQSESDMSHSGAEVNIADRIGGNIVIYTCESETFPEYNMMGKILKLCSAVWFIGAAAMAVYGTATYIALKWKLKGAVNHGGYYTCGNINNPFILGIIKPKIYLPEGLSERERELIMLHEQSHISYGDNIAKIIMYAALCIHWFDPLVWLSFRLCERDMEIFCDSRVTSKMDSIDCADYCQALLNISSGKAAAFTACFGESSTKSRIKSILKYKKPALWIIVVCTVLAAATVIFLSVDRADAYATSQSEKNVFDVVGLPGEVLEDAYVALQSAENVFEAAGLLDEQPFSGFNISSDDRFSEAFFIDDENTPKAAVLFSEKFGALTLGTRRNDSILDENKTTYTIRAYLVVYELSYDGENAELYAWNTVEGSVAYYKISVGDYKALAVLAEELLAYKTPVTYDDSAIKSILSEPPVAVGVTDSTIYKMQLTKEAQDKVINLLQGFEYTPLPDDFEIISERAVLELYYDHFGDDAPIVLGLVNGSRNHGTEGAYAVSIYGADPILNYSVDREDFEAVYDILYRGENYVYD